MLSDSQSIATLNQGGNLMSQVIGLNLSGSFAEISTVTDQGPHFDRLLTSNFSLKPVLQKMKALFSSDQEIEFHVTTPLAYEIVKKQLGNPPALIVTQGFENWLEMNLPMEHVSLEKQKRAIPPVLRDLTFGLNERTNAQGEVLTPVSTQELNLIASKLELHGVKNVALCLLHSTSNSENFKTCHNYLTERGLTVFSCHTQHPNERHRWLTATLNGYAFRQFNELLENITADIQSHYPNSKVKFLTESGFYNPGDTDILPTQFALIQRLTQHLSAQNQNFNFGLHLGLEDIELISIKTSNLHSWQSPWGCCALDHPHVERLQLQATQLLKNGFWDCPEFSDQECSYSPGPISFGKSTNLTLLDILNKLGWLKDIPGVSDHIRPQTQKRVDESLYTYSKEAIREDNLHIGGVAQELGELALQNWAIEIQQKTGGQDLLAFGPLAESLYPHLKQKLPNLQLTSQNQHAFCASHSIYEGRL